MHKFSQSKKGNDFYGSEEKLDIFRRANLHQNLTLVALSMMYKATLINRNRWI